ncbi:hypothetical protein [Ruminococcus sp.]|uniref:hypothetical protein n=1 Tax=Ruminococcus sp. TaxID=41978 RepID=UPI0025D53D9F|nr:hypothetical protein [Ruminococcus sp.]
MTETKHCKICGKEIGNIYETDYFSLISRQYCQDCRKQSDRQNSRIRSKKYREKKKLELEEAKKKAQAVQEENEELQQQIRALRSIID